MEGLKKYLEEKRKAISEYIEKKKMQGQVAAEKNARRLEAEADYQEKKAERYTRAEEARKRIAKSKAVIHRNSGFGQALNSLGKMADNLKMQDFGNESMFDSPKKGKKKKRSSDNFFDMRGMF